MDNIIRHMHFNGGNQYEVVHIGSINDLQSCTLQVMVINLASSLLRLKWIQSTLDNRYRVQPKQDL